MFRLPPLTSLARLPDVALVAESWLLPGGERRMRHRSVRVERRLVSYGVVEGDGPTAIVVHGWGLAHPSYARAAEHLAGEGYRVVVPDLPGFGRSSGLPLWRISFHGFAQVLAAFLRELGTEGDPVHLVGHSFGGAVCAQLAHDHPELVRSVVLVSSVSCATWLRDEDGERLLAERPIWDWGRHLLSDFPLGEFPHAARSVLNDLGHNLTFNLPTLGMVGSLIRRADLRSVLESVAAGGVPCAVVWPSNDHVVTRASFEDQCSALGCEGLVVEGNHGWPFADPRSFGRVVGRLLAGGSERPPPAHLPRRRAGAPSV